jgi:hypothetical protein
VDTKKTTGSGYTSKVHLWNKYHIVGFISSGTYGRVYKAVGRHGQRGEFAIKKSVIVLHLIGMLLTCIGSNPTKKES